MRITLRRTLRVPSLQKCVATFLCVRRLCTSTDFSHHHLRSCYRIRTRATSTSRKHHCVLLRPGPQRTKGLVSLSCMVLFVLALQPIQISIRETISHETTQLLPSISIHEPVSSFISSPLIAIQQQQQHGARRQAFVPRIFPSLSLSLFSISAKNHECNVAWVEVSSIRFFFVCFCASTIDETSLQSYLWPIDALSPFLFFCYYPVTLVKQRDDTLLLCVCPLSLPGFSSANSYVGRQRW